MMNKKPPLTGKTFRLIAAYSRLPSKGRTALDRLVEYLAVIDKAAFPKARILEKPQTVKRRDV
jgi:hypothetical protein